MSGEEKYGKSLYRMRRNARIFCNWLREWRGTMGKQRYMPLNFNFVNRSIFTSVSPFRYREFAWCLHVMNVLTLIVNAQINRFQS